MARINIIEQGQTLGAGVTPFSLVRLVGTTWILADEKLAQGVYQGGNIVVTDYSEVVSGTTQDATIYWGTISAGTQLVKTLTVQNDDINSTSVTDINITGSRFTCTFGDLPIVVPAGESTDIDITFYPLEDGDYSGELVITTTYDVSPFTVDLVGSATSYIDAVDYYSIVDNRLIQQYKR